MTANRDGVARMPSGLRCVLAAGLLSVSTHTQAVCPSYTLSESDLTEILASNLSGGKMAGAKVRIRLNPACRIYLTASGLGIELTACTDIRHDARHLGVEPFKVLASGWLNGESGLIKPDMADVSNRIAKHCGYQADIRNVTIEHGIVAVNFVD